MRRLALALVLAGGAAHAGGLDELATPRAVGRAGVGTVSDDGAAAVFTNPAALARRSAWRAQLGLAIVDDGLAHVPDLPDAPEARAHDDPALQPIVAAQVGVGPIVVGAGFATDVAGRRFGSPEPGLPPDAIATFFGYRYAGMSARIERRTAAIAAAARVTDWLAVGVTGTLASVRIEERRRLWAGFTGRGDVPGDPTHDVEVALAGDDSVVPGAAFAVFVAPAALPLEAAAAVAFANRVHVRGGSGFTVGDPAVLGVEVPDSSARLDLPSPVVARLGARWLGERWIAELGFDAVLPPDTDPITWRLAGARVIDVATGFTGDVRTIPSRWSPRRRYAVRGAADVEIVPGFVWLTAGYAWRNAGTPTDRFAPTTAELAGHTTALGAEIVAGGVTATLGWSRTWLGARRARSSELGLDNPFAPEPALTGLGRYDGARDVVGISLEVAGE